MKQFQNFTESVESVTKLKNFLLDNNVQQYENKYIIQKVREECYELVKEINKQEQILMETESLLHVNVNKIDLEDELIMEALDVLLVICQLLELQTSSKLRSQRVRWVQKFATRFLDEINTNNNKDKKLIN